MRSCFKGPLEIVLEKHCDELSVNESEVEGLGFPGNTHGLRNEGRENFHPRSLRKEWNVLPRNDNLFFQHSFEFPAFPFQAPDKKNI